MNTAMSDGEKPYSPACDENRQPILDVIRQVFSRPGVVLEVGSGTGQHAAWLPRFLPHLTWQPSDVAENLPGIRAWLDEAALSNVLPPLGLDVMQTPWPVMACDYVFSANTVHIMSWPMVESFFAGVGRVLEPGGSFCLYGPFMYNGHHTAESNAEFDVWLKARDPESGVRDAADLDRLAYASGMERIDDFEMPVNNRILHWRRVAGG
jgi:SAM-dependent methyltransferase